MASQSTRLSVASLSGDDSLPALMLFPSGLPASSSLSNDKDGGLKIDMMRKTSAKHKHHMELHAQSERMRYSGQNYGREGSAARAGGTLLVGVHDKTTGLTRVVPASALFVMQQSIKEPRVSFEPPAATEEMQTYGAQKRQLVSTLGAAKARKRQDQQAAAAVNANAVFNAATLSADIASAADAAHVVAALPESQRNEAEMRPLHPPFDLAATTVAQAYPRSGLIPEYVWLGLDYTSLKELSKSTAKRDRAVAESPQLWPAYIVDTLDDPLPTEKSARHGYLKQLTFLTYMLRFVTISGPIKPKKRDAGRGDYQQDAAKLQIPLSAWDQLLAQYTEQDLRDGMPIPSEEDADHGGAQSARAPKRLLTRTCREKLCLHVLTLALVLRDGRLPCAALASSLSLTEEKCAFYLKQLGCTVDAKHRAGGEGGRVAVLKLPLTFPKLSRGAPASR